MPFLLFLCHSIISDIIQSFSYHSIFGSYGEKLGLENYYAHSIVAGAGDTLEAKTNDGLSFFCYIQYIFSIYMTYKEQYYRQYRKGLHDYCAV